MHVQSASTADVERSECGDADGGKPVSIDRVPKRQRVLDDSHDAAGQSPAQAAKPDPSTTNRPACQTPRQEQERDASAPGGTAPSSSENKPVSPQNARSSRPSAEPARSPSPHSHDSDMLLHRYVELLRSQNPQHVLQALNPLLLLSRNDAHARVLAQYSPLFPALFSAVHAYHVAIGVHITRCDSVSYRATPTGSGASVPEAKEQQPAQPTTGDATNNSGEVTDEADPGETGKSGMTDAQHRGPASHSSTEEAWRSQLAVAAATVVHHLTLASSSCMSPECMSGVHIICLQHLPLLQSQPSPAVLEIALLLLSAARATMKTAAAFSALSLCERLLPFISDPSSPVQVKSLAASTIADALASGNRRLLVRHLSANHPREPFEAAHSLLRNTCTAHQIRRMLPEQNPFEAGPQEQQGQHEQEPTYARCMAKLWQAHLVACGVRLARELLTCMVAGYANAAVVGLETNGTERVSRTFKVGPPLPLLRCSAPVSPSLRHLSAQQRPRRPRCSFGGVSTGSNGHAGGGLQNGVTGANLGGDPATPTFDGGPSHHFSFGGVAPSALVSPAASAPASPSARARAGRSQLAHSFPNGRVHGAAACSAGAGASMFTQDCAGLASVYGQSPLLAPAGSSAAAAAPAAGLLGSSSRRGGPAQPSPMDDKLRGKEEDVGLPEQVFKAATGGTDSIAQQAQHGHHVMHVQGQEVPFTGSGEVVHGGREQGFPLHAGLNADLEAGPGSPSFSMEHMPSFSRWISMSLSRSISFGGPRGADGVETPDTETLPSGSGTVAGGPSASAGAESVRRQGNTSPTFTGDAAWPQLQPISLPPQISLVPPLPHACDGHMENGVSLTGSCDVLPDVTFPAADSCGQSGETLHIPAALVQTLCNVAMRSKALAPRVQWEDGIGGAGRPVEGSAAPHATAPDLAGATCGHAQHESRIGGVAAGVNENSAGAVGVTGETDRASPQQPVDTKAVDDERARLSSQQQPAGGASFLAGENSTSKVDAACTPAVAVATTGVAQDSTSKTVLPCADETPAPAGTVQEASEGPIEVDHEAAATRQRAEEALAAVDAVDSGHNDSEQAARCAPTTDHTAEPHVSKRRSSLQGTAEDDGGASLQPLPPAASVAQGAPPVGAGVASQRAQQHPPSQGCIEGSAGGNVQLQALVSITDERVAQAAQQALAVAAQLPELAAQVPSLRNAVSSEMLLSELQDPGNPFAHNPSGPSSHPTGLDQRLVESLLNMSSSGYSVVALDPLGALT